MNSVLHNNRHKVIHNAIESLPVDMHDMHIPSRNILKVTKFQKRLTIEEFLKFLRSLKTKRLFSLAAYVALD
jgi:hypothetical protein